jgi:hypothetical protein
VQVIRAVFLGFLFAAGLAHAGVESAKLYSGPEGMKLTLVRLSGDPAILIYVQGSESRYDGKVLPCTSSDEGNRTYYGTQWAGRDVYPFHVVNHGGGRSYVFYPGSNQREIPLKWDETGSEALKPAEVLKLYEAQEKDGTLTRWMAFDRPAEQAQAEKTVAEQVKETQQACGGHAFGLRVQWASVTDEILKKYSVASFCGAPLEALARLCEFPSVREHLQAHVKSVECTFGSQVALGLESGVARWTTSTEGSNLEDAARKAFQDALGGPETEIKDSQPAWGAGKSLRELEALDRTSVCTDAMGYVAVSAPADRGNRLYSGKGRTLVQTCPAAWGVPGDMFLDPRFVNPTANPNFRGSDMRVHSALEVDRAKQRCTLRCGTRTAQLQLLDSQTARDLIVGAKIEENPQQYGPHALLRDDLGLYYYVDKGIRRGNERSFRVFRGNKGKLEQQKLTNLVADSEGEVFSTRTGELRLVIDREEGSSWVQAKNRVKLRRVPVEENLPLIYNELGVYQGVRLGTPCDDAPF